MPDRSLPQEQARAFRGETRPRGGASCAFLPPRLPAQGIKGGAHKVALASEASDALMEQVGEPQPLPGMVGLPIHLRLSALPPFTRPIAEGEQLGRNNPRLLWCIVLQFATHVQRWCGGTE